MEPNTIELPSNRSFGMLFFVIFLAASGYLWYLDSINFSLALFTISIAIFLSTLLRPVILTPLNRAWFKLGLGLSAVTSPIIMGIIYFLMFVPMALVLRSIGRDELKLRIKDQVTHWKKRPERALARKSYFHDQF